MPTINKSAQNMVNAIQTRLDNNEEVEVKQCVFLIFNLEISSLAPNWCSLCSAMGNFTLDAVAATLFGVNIGEQSDDKKIFYKHARGAFNDFSSPLLLLIFIAASL